MCDTFVALPSVTKDGSVLFGKNSDREPNEAQLLEYHAPGSFQAGEELRCTYITIPQVKITNAILISRPFWMWGAEMGANDQGVVIGNEAVFTKMPLRKDNTLTGMDLLRLALERGDSAQAALETIVELIQDYGQGGRCGYEDKHLSYHNSYIIADPQEAWVLETAGHLWVARQVLDSYSISNGLTIGEEWDLAHPDLISFARKKGWIKQGSEFNFSEVYSDWFYTTFSASRKRRSCSRKIIEMERGALDIKTAFRVLRDHGMADYRPDSHLLMNRVCAHAALPLVRHASQSTGSLVAHLTKRENTFWVTGTSAPCSSLFKPFRFKQGSLPEFTHRGGENYNENSLWWRHEKLHRSILQDFQPRLAMVKEARDDLEAEFLKFAYASEIHSLDSVTLKAFQTEFDRIPEWVNLVKNEPVRKRPSLLYRRYWNRQNRKAGI
jgi:dipeptidase